MPCYLISAGDTDRVKIGWAINAQSRLRELQPGCWETLRILRTWRGDRMVEAWLHEKFSCLRIAREWFWFSPAMLEIEPPEFPGPSFVKDDLMTPIDIESMANESGVTIADVCRKAGIERSTFTRWKNGSTEPTLDVYRRIRDASRSFLTVSVEQIP